MADRRFHPHHDKYIAAPAKTVMMKKITKAGVRKLHPGPDPEPPSSCQSKMPLWASDYG